MTQISYLFFKNTLDLLKELEKQGEEGYIYTIITYMAGVGETPHQGEFLQAIKKLESVTEEKLMTLVEYLKPELLKRVSDQARTLALEEGLEKGRYERDIEIAKAMLLKGIDLETVAEVTGHSKEELKKLLS